MVSKRRVAELQNMFDQIGLGRPEERKRLATLGTADLAESAASGNAPEEQVFIRLESNTADPGETLNG